MNSTDIFAPEARIDVLPKAGDILCGTYGYEASIATFAKVISVKNKTVMIVELDRKDVYKPGGMEWTSSPMVDNPISAPVRKKFSPTGDGSYRIKWNSYMNLHKWLGSPINCYNYH